MTKRLVWMAVVLLAVLLLPVRPAAAQQPTPSDDQVNAIARQLFCPVCQNTPLDVCPTEACRQWRELIRQMLAQGRSEDYIKQYFVDNYGARVLAEPPRTGINWLVYLVPPIAFVAGAYLLIRAYRAWHGTPKSPGAPPAADDEYAARLEEELRQRR